MEIPNHIAEEYIIPKNYYVKPEIVIGNYYVKWDDSSYGVTQKEVAELKSTLNGLVPYISAAIFDAAKEIHSIIEEKTTTDKARRIEEIFSPELLLSRKRGDITYMLRIRRDGTTLISRREKIVFNDKEQVYIMWELGELLFNRRKSR